MVLVSQSSTDSALSADSWTTGESSRRNSESGIVYQNDEGCYRCITTLTGHSGPVSSLAVVGGLIYSGGSHGSDIRIWSQPDLQDVCSFGTGEGAVKALLVTGGMIFSAHQDMKIRVWKAAATAGRREPKLAATLPTMKDYLLRCVPPKNYVQVRRHKKSLWIQHNDTISVLAQGVGNVLYSGSWDKTVKVWRLSDLRCLESIVAHDDAVSALAADQEGYLYTASADASVKVWAKTGKKHALVSTLKGHKSSVNALAFSPDEKVLYSASSDKTITVWERSKVGDEHMTMAGVLRGHRQAVLCLATVGNIVVSGSADKTIRVWKRGHDNSHTCIGVLEGHRGAVKTVVASMEAVQEGVLIYSGGVDRLVKIWFLSPREDGFQSDVSQASATAASPLRWRF